MQLVGAASDPTCGVGAAAAATPAAHTPCSHPLLCPQAAWRAALSLSSRHSSSRAKGPAPAAPTPRAAYAMRCGRRSSSSGAAAAGGKPTQVSDCWGRGQHRTGNGSVSWNRRCAADQVASSASLIQPNATILTLLMPAPLRAPSRAHLPAADWISSQLTRRFGLAGGLAWVGFLTFGVLSEQASGLGSGGVASAHGKGLRSRQLTACILTQQLQLQPLSRPRAATLLRKHVCAADQDAAGGGQRGSQHS